MKQEYIETFLTLVQTKNISLCAEQLFTSQSNISNRLRHLEEELEVTLFIRSKGHQQIELTQSGKDFVPIAHQFMSVVQDMQTLKNQQHRQTFHIGGVDYINQNLFLPMYKQIMQAEKNLRLNIQTHHSNQLTELVRKHQIDLAFTFNRTNNEELICTPLFEEQMIVVTGHKSTVEQFSDLKSEQEIYLRWNDNYEHWHNQYWDANQSYMQIGTARQALEYLDQQNLWTILPSSILNIDTTLRNPKIKLDAPTRTCYMIEHRYTDQSKIDALQTIKQYIKQFRT